jgi:hypothetical protein
MRPASPPFDPRALTIAPPAHQRYVDLGAGRVIGVGGKYLLEDNVRVATTTRRETVKGVVGRAEKWGAALEIRGLKKGAASSCSRVECMCVGGRGAFGAEFVMHHEME